MSFGEEDLHDLPVHAADDRVGVQRGHRAEPDQVNVNITRGRCRGNDANLVARAAAVLTGPGLAGCRGCRGLAFLQESRQVTGQEKINASRACGHEDQQEQDPDTEAQALFPGPHRRRGDTVRRRRPVRMRSGRRLWLGIFLLEYVLCHNDLKN